MDALGLRQPRRSPATTGAAARRASPPSSRPSACARSSPSAATTSRTRSRRRSRPSALEERMYWYQWYFNTERGRAGPRAEPSRHLQVPVEGLVADVAVRRRRVRRARRRRSTTPTSCRVVIHSYRHRHLNAPSDPRFDDDRASPRDAAADQGADDGPARRRRRGVVRRSDERAGAVPGGHGAARHPGRRPLHAARGSRRPRRRAPRPFSGRVGAHAHRDHLHRRRSPDRQDRQLQLQLHEPEARGRRPLGALGTTVGDDRENLLHAFQLAAERADAVIVNGGLGPTVDDLSQEIAAQAAGCRAACSTRSGSRGWRTSSSAAAA